MAATYIASAVLMALLALAVVIAVARQGWYRYTPRAAGEGGGWPRTGPQQPGILARPVTWVVAFVLTAFIAIGGVLWIVTDPGPTTLTDPPALVIGGLVLVYLVLGTYLASRDRGHSHAFALGLASLVVGVLLLLGVVVQLLT